MIVSIISPVYNSAPYIGACIESLKKQTLSDFEVLLVDDHGQDNSIEVARQCIGDDPRFRILATPANAGPGIARNVGLDAAQGEFVAFIDSDDQWHPNFLSAMVAKAQALATTGNDGRQTPADLVYCQLQYKGGNKDGEVFRNPVIEDGEFIGQSRRHFLTRFTTFSVCFLYRTQFLNDHQLRFPAGRSSEDTHFLVRALLYAQTVACVDQPYYYYCLQESSLTQRPDENRYLVKMQAMENLLADCQQRGLYDGDNAVVLDYLFVKKGYAVAAMNYLQHAQQPDSGKLTDLTRRLDAAVPHWKSNELLNADVKSRIVVHLLYNVPWLATRLLPLIIKNKAL